MTSFTCVSWVCVLTLLFLGQSSDAEHLTEMDERRSVIENYVQKKLDALEKKLKTEIDENTALQNQVSNLNKVVKTLDKGVKRLTNAIDGLMDEDRQLKEADKKLGKELKEADKKQVSTTRCLAQKVGFMATLAKNGDTTVKGGQTIIYDKVISNIGNAYNPGNGRFTATSPGMYAFTVTAYTRYSTHHTNLNIKVNDEIVTSEFIYNNSGDSNNSGSARAVVQLSAGDVVAVEASVLLGINTMYQRGSWYINTNTFSGALIQPDCPQ